jgi:hypothetical protein
MVSGLIGSHGHLVLLRVVEAANHEHVRVQTLHQQMAGETVKELHQRHRHVQPTNAQVI